MCWRNLSMKFDKMDVASMRKPNGLSRYFALLCAALMASPICAQAQNFTGPYVSVGLGSSQITDPQVNYSVSQGGYAGGIPNGWAALLRERGGSASVALGYDAELAGFIIGVQGRVERRNLNVVDVETQFGVPVPSWLTRYESDLSRQVNLRLGRVFGDRALGYVSLGRASTEYTRTYTHTNGGEDVFHGTEAGRVIGIGYEIDWTGNWNFAVDVRRTTYETTVNTVVNAYPQPEDAAHDAIENSISFMLVRRF